MANITYKTLAAEGNCNPDLLWSSGNCPVPYWMWITRKNICKSSSLSVAMNRKWGDIFVSSSAGLAGLELFKMQVMPHVLCATISAHLTPKGTLSPWWDSDPTALRDAVGRSTEAPCIPLDNGEWVQVISPDDFPAFGCFGNAWDGFGRVISQMALRVNCFWGTCQSFTHSKFHLCCSGVKGTNCFLNLTEQFSFLC